MDLSKIKQKLTILKPELHERFGVTEIGVFGSYARGEQKRGSDIDLLVSFDRTITLFGLYDLQEFFKAKISSKNRYRYEKRVENANRCANFG